MAAIATQPKTVPTTGRTPEFLARQYGFKTLDQFIASIPKNAQVLDIGAGVSALGHKVAAARPDITWVNVDLCYARADLLQAVKRRAPRNLHFMVGDIVNLSANLRALQGKIDCVYSYWLVPHLSLEHMQPAEQAVKNMWLLLKPKGIVAVGPVRRAGFLSWFRYSSAVHASGETPQHEAARRISVATKLHWTLRPIQAFGNRHNIHIGPHLLALLHKSAAD